MHALRGPTQVQHNKQHNKQVQRSVQALRGPKQTTTQSAHPLTILAQGFEDHPVFKTHPPTPYAGASYRETAASFALLGFSVRGAHVYKEQICKGASDRETAASFALLGFSVSGAGA